MRHLFFQLLLLLLLALPAAAAGEPSPELLESLAKSAAGVKTLASDFVQEKHLAMFKKKVTSKGRFYFARPDSLRWELTEPVASGFVLKGDKGRRWHARTGRSETFSIGQDPVMRIVAEQLLAWTRADFARLKKEYRIQVLEDSPVSLRLEPLAGPAGGFLSHLLVAFSADGRHLKSVELHEKDGDFTRIRFQNTAVNRQLDADLF